jgi:hypothetical protein
MAPRLHFIRSTTALIYLFAGWGSLVAHTSKPSGRNSNPCVDNAHSVNESAPPLKILGLVDPAVVSGAISISVSGVKPGQPVTYCLDKAPISVSPYAQHAPGTEAGSSIDVLSVRSLSPGEHHLQAVALLPDGGSMLSNVVSLHVVPDIDQTFSSGLKAYAPPTAEQPLSVILQQTDTPGAGLTPEEVETRSRIASMYLNFGFDVSLDHANDLSDLLPTLLPGGWVTPKPHAQSPLSMRFSADAPFYHPVPANWPRVRLPRGYIKTFQLNTNQKGDGLGYGIAIAQSDSPTVAISSMWYEQEATRKTIPFQVPSDWSKVMPAHEAGDRHIIFIDPKEDTFVSLYKASVDPKTHEPHALYASSPASFNSLGDRGGSTASRFSELPLLIQPGEATQADAPIRHALGGSVSRVWAARVYPATARDYGMLTSTNTCTHKGMTNTGLVPYGGIIQLDPALDLDKMKLSRPARRILQAIQTYGYYVMDFGCADLDIYTAISEEELFPYAGLYGFPTTGPGVEKEIAQVLTTNDLYVTPPITKRPSPDQMIQITRNQ